MRKPLVILLLSVLALATVGPARADVELVLKNGTIVPGVDLERRGSMYVVRLHSGQDMRVPMNLVESVRLSGATESRADSDEPPADQGEPAPWAGLAVEEAATVAGQEVEQPETAAGIQRGSPGTVAGQEVEGPDYPAYPDKGGGEAPRAGVIEGGPAIVSDPQRWNNSAPSGTWVPQSDWPESDWPRADDSGRPEWNGADVPEWTPENALDPDASNFAPSEWMKAPDSTWTPKDGFSKNNTAYAGGRSGARMVRTSASIAVASAVPDRPRPQLGVASWYGAEHEGDTTASGSPFDMTAFTAASPDLPFGSLVLVTNLDNRKNILVEITDRLSASAGRAINLSRAAAEQIDMVDRGLAPVRMETVPATTPAPEPSVAPDTSAAAAPSPISP